MFTENFSAYKLDFHGVRLPEITVSDVDKQRVGLVSQHSNFDYLRKLCENGLEQRINEGKIQLSQKNIYIQKYESELQIFKNNGLVDYFLLLYDILKWCDENDIARGISRGSAAGSCVLFLLRITNICPVTHNLSFSRFMNEARLKSKEIDGVLYFQGSSLMDVDSDISYINRNKVIDYIYSKYPGKVSKISTLTTLSSKIVLKEILKVFLNYSEEESKHISDNIESHFGTLDSIETTLKINKKIQEFKNANKRNSIALGIAQKLENLICGRGQHPSGIAISYYNLNETIPTELTPKRDGVMTSYNKDVVSEFLIKGDFLGLKNADINYNTAKNLGINLNSININERSIYDYYKNSELFYGLFQIECGLTKQVVIKVKPKNIDELSCCLAISRPGALKYIDQYNDYVNRGCLTKIHPEFDRVLRSTGNILIYQEQITAICCEIYKLTETEADHVRYCIGKKLPQEILKWEPVLYQKGKENNIPEKITKYFWETCLDSSDYLFNQCLSPDTIVETLNGPKVMSDIIIGEKIRAYDTDNKIDVFVEVVKVYRNAKYIYEVILSDGRKVECSMCHKFLCADLQMHPLITIMEQKLNLFGNVGLKSVTHQRYDKTLDFEVNHNDHNFYANNIIVSNSHCFSYAYMTAINTYFKANHPKEFYLALLRMAKDEAKNNEIFNEIYIEMTHFGIKLYPPHIINSGIDFEIYKDGIIFGLGGIKGINEKSIAKLNDFRSKYSNKFEIFAAADQAKLPQNIMASLIYCGSLDDMLTESRSRTFLEFVLWHLLTPKEKQKVLDFGPEYNFDLITLVKDLNRKLKDIKGKFLIKDSRYQTIKTKFTPYLEIYKHNNKNEKLCQYFFEHSLVGFSYSTTLIDLYKGHCPDLITIQNSKQLITNEPFHVVGRVVEFKEGLSKNKNNYWKLLLADHTGQELVLVANSAKIDKLEEITENNGGDKPKVNDIVVVRGNKGDDILFGKTCSIQPTKIFQKVSELKIGVDKDVES